MEVDKLVVEGGKPVRESFLSYGRQSINEDDIQSVVKVLKGDYLTTGPYVKAFEDKIAAYVGAKYAVAVTSGTSALHTALHGIGINKGDEVIVTPLTFAASANAILYCGAVPVFADIDSKTFNIDYRSVESKITAKTKAILPVHFAGQPVDCDELKEIAQKHHLKIVEDGAHALGSSYKGEKIGHFSEATTFSFHPVKPITTGEGGIITTNSREIYERMAAFRTHGITRDRAKLLESGEGAWHYEQQELGYNFRMTDLQAALGISQLVRLDAFIKRRREIAKKYNEAFKSLQAVITPYEKEDRKSGYHIYVIKLNLDALKVGRKQIYEALIAENIGVNVHYIPVYYHPYYRKIGYHKGLCPNAEQVYEQILTLPLFPAMLESDIQDVIEAVYKVINYYMK